MSYKAQYKQSSGGAWNTKTSGSEMGCFAEYERLKQKYPFARVVDKDGKVVS